LLSASTLSSYRDVTLEQITIADGGVVGVLRASRPVVPCPLCRHLAHRIHSRYPRTLVDLPTQGLAVRLDLHTRRFWCDEPSCPRKIFAERFPGLVAPGARRTTRLSSLYLALGLALGGEAGARLATDLGLRVSPDTVLRSTAAPVPAPPTPRIIGVDDWSWRKGRRWGTILVDLERRRTIDILPDRSADTLARRLKVRPSITIVARDRAGAYAEGIRQGAPQALQLADRFHLVKNAGEVLERVVQRHYASLRAAAKALDQKREEVTSPAAEAVLSPSTAHAEMAAAQPAPLSHAQEQRRLRYEEVVTLAKEGLGPRAIGQRIGLTRQTVARWLAAGTFPERAPSAPRTMLVTPYEPYLRQRWQAGCQNSRQLWREVREQGFAGGQETVRRLVVQWHAEQGRPGPPRRHGRVAPLTPPPPPAPVTRPWSPRQARWLLIKGEESLQAEQQAYPTSANSTGGC
jgi:transposase